MTTEVIVLNGGSSSGKSTIARHLQAILAEPWLATGVDTFVEMLPPALQTGDDGLEVSPSGQVLVGGTFRRLEAVWMRGVAAMARAGGRVIIDDVFLGGASSQQRWRAALAGVEIVWVGVRCDADVASRRELERPDRPEGMAAAQAELVH
ncbi:MAG TPA: AAA family ATPase, partial [Acidimicrobiales bacterium]